MSVLVGGPGTVKGALSRYRDRRPGHPAAPQARPILLLPLASSALSNRKRSFRESLASSPARLIHSDLVILDELGYLPFSASGGALLFHLWARLYERASVIITTDVSFGEWATVFGDAEDDDRATRIRLTHRCCMLAIREWQLPLQA